jgi:hypothetical protein
MAKIRTQADRRQISTVMDQHGRKYRVFVEKDTMHPCSPPAPKDWAPPLLAGRTPFVAPENYLFYPKDDPFSMTIDYDRWIADLEQQHKSYEERLSTAAVMMYGSQAAQALENKNPELLRFVGPPPMAVEPIKAAKAGNKFVLGLSDKMPTWATPFFTAPAKAVEEFPDVEDYPNEDEPAAAEVESADDDEGFEPATDDELTADADEDVDDAVDAEDDVERFLAIEEEVDPAAAGGKKKDPRPAEKRKGAKRKAGAKG